VPGSAARALGYNDDTDNELYRMYHIRANAPNDQLTQDLAGPGEHRQFMEEITSQSPMQGTATMAMAIPYSAAKTLGMAPGGTGEAKTSRASMDEIFAAGEGYWEGMKKAFPSKTKPFWKWNEADDAAHKARMRRRFGR
jgi:hypothetical protein